MRDFKSVHLAALNSTIGWLALLTLSAPVHPHRQRVPIAEASRFGAPLVIDGERISDEALELFLVYGPCHAALDARVSHAFVEEELRARATSAAAREMEKRTSAEPGASRATLESERTAAFERALDELHHTYQVSDAAIDAEFAYQIARCRTAYPTIDLDAAVDRAFHDAALWRTQARSDLELDRVFLPDDPNEWPASTREAVQADSGNVLLEDARSSYAARSKERAPDGTLPREDIIYVNMLRSILRNRFTSSVSYRTAVDGIPAGLALRLGSLDGDQPMLTIALDNIWKEIEPSVSTGDVREAKRWLVAYTATKHRLQREGRLADGAQNRSALATLFDENDRSRENLSGVATVTLGFPSLDAYEQYYLLEKSFERALLPQLELALDGSSPPMLRAAFERESPVLGLARVDADVILVSAFDIPHCRWKPDGWSWAEKSARELRAALDANAASYVREHASGASTASTPDANAPTAIEPSQFWTQMMNEHSEYWDQPLSQDPSRTDCRDFMHDKGRFGPSYYDSLMTKIGETYYDDWASGNSITRQIFFDQAEQTVAGPFHGPQGYYLTFLHKRFPPQRPLDVHDAKQIEQVRQLYLRSAFADYAREAVARAVVTGFAR